MIIDVSRKVGKIVYAPRALSKQRGIEKLRMATNYTRKR